MLYHIVPYCTILSIFVQCVTYHMDICLIMFGTNMVWMIYPFQTMFWMGMSDMVHQLLGYPIFGQTYTKP